MEPKNSGPPKGGPLRRIFEVIDAVPGVSQSALGNYAMVLGQTLRTLLLARILGPATFGVLSMSNVAANFTSFAEFGTSVVADQQASTARARRQDEEMLEALRASAGARLAPALALAVLLLVGAAISAFTGHAGAIPVFVFLAASAPVQAVWFACRGYLRVIGRFDLATRAQLLQTSIWVTLVPIAAWLWGLNGAFVAIVASFFPPILASFRIVPWSLALQPSWSSFIRLAPKGFYIWFALTASFAFIYVDQFLVGTLLGTESVGIYAIASVTSSVLLAFSDGAAAAAHPQTLEAYAEHGRLTLSTKPITRTIRTTQLLLGILTPLSWLGLALLVLIALPAYAPALEVVVLLGPSAVAVGLTTAANSALLAVGRHRRVPYFYLIAIAVKVAVAIILLTWHPSLEVFALATFIASLAFASLYYFELGSAIGLDSRGRAVWIVRHLFTPVALAVIGGLSLLWGPHPPIDFAGFSLGATAISLLVHLALYRLHPGRDS